MLFKYRCLRVEEKVFLTRRQVAKDGERGESDTRVQVKEKDTRSPALAVGRKTSESEKLVHSATDRKGRVEKDKTRRSARREAKDHFAEKALLGRNAGIALGSSTRSGPLKEINEKTNNLLRKQ